MNKILMEMKGKRFSPPPEQQYIVLPPPSSLHTSGFNLNNKVSPSVLLIIIVLAIIFFISGLLHLLVRYLVRPPTRDPDEIDNVTALQGQLQQLFHLHDAGVDQSFIDTLPIFNYKAIIGVKSPFDCAVCLSEFEADDNLRLLPKCSHAFHMECIDTWLLSHSTCPLCRASLIPDFSSNRHSSAIVLVLESGSETSREIVPDLCTNNNSVARVSSQRSDRPNDESKLPISGILQKSSEIQAREEEDDDNSGAKVVTVKLGKFRNVDGGCEGSSSTNSNNVDSRRCFSMGSFAYLMDENSTLQVPIRTPIKKQSSKKPSLPLIPGHRPAMSECGCDSRREFIGFETFRNVDIQGNGNANSDDKAINRDSRRRESVSISKIWLRGKKDEANLASEQSSRRAFSFRFPGQGNVIAEEDLKANNKNCGRRRTISEIDIGRWENGRSEIACDVETQSCNSLDSLSAKTPSFARRTLLWLMGRPNKVVHSQFSGNV